MWSGIALLPIFAWELSLGLYLAIKGFKPAAMAALDSETRKADEAAVPTPSSTVIATKVAAA